jgi:hypothetical protein
MAKTINMKKPARTVDEFVTNAEKHETNTLSSSTPPSATEFAGKRRITIDLPADLYKRLRMDTVEKDTTMVDIITTMLYKHYNRAK